MEEAEILLEHLHEEIHHHAEHRGAPWISWVALSTAILAVLAAIAGLLSGHRANEAMMNQIEASDQWAYYQFQILIAIAAISALTKKRRFWLVSLVFGLAGAVFLVLGSMAH